MQSILTSLASMGFDANDIQNIMGMAQQFFASAPSYNAYASGWAPIPHGFVPSEIGFGKPLLPGTGDALAGGGGGMPVDNMPVFVPGLTGGVTGLSNANLYNGGAYSPVQQGGPVGPYFQANADPRVATLSGGGGGTWTEGSGHQQQYYDNGEVAVHKYNPQTNGYEVMPQRFSPDPYNEYGSMSQPVSTGSNYYGDY